MKKVLVLALLWICLHVTNAQTPGNNTEEEIRGRKDDTRKTQEILGKEKTVEKRIQSKVMNAEEMKEKDENVQDLIENIEGISTKEENESSEERSVREDKEYGEKTLSSEEAKEKEGTAREETVGEQITGWFLEDEEVNVTARASITQPKSTTTPSNEQSTFNNEMLVLVFHVPGRQVVLDLFPNRDLLGENYTEPHSPSTKNAAPGGNVPCEYQGEIRGVADSWAALSLCGTIRGVIAGAGQEVLVEPLLGVNSLEGPHRLFSASLLHVDQTCGVKTPKEKEVKSNIKVDANRSGNSTEYNMDYRHDRVKRGLLLHGPLWTDRNSRFVEVVMVVDHSYYLKHGENVYQRCRSIINIVNALFRDLGVVVVLTDLEVWKERDLIEVSEDHEGTLQNLKPYRRQLLREKPNLPNDDTVLITNVDFTGSTVGFASVSGICGLDNSVAVVEDRNSPVGVVAQTMAHELGHNLGMEHDGDDCTCGTTRCIMAATGSRIYKPYIQWSSCSREVVARNLGSGNYDCLKNVPSKLYHESSCGNGVVEDGETCDCGPPHFCSNPSCCDPHTCQLATNATCASGSCCNTETCNFKDAGEVCRATATDCDLPEYCSGSSESCPENVYARDGIPCADNQGHCYHGHCGSHDQRCQQVWGDLTKRSDQSCFNVFNVRGTETGNCGLQTPFSSQFKSCAKKDVLCGTLNCHPEEHVKSTKLSGEALTMAWMTLSSGAKCYHIKGSPNLPPTYYLTPNGASCGRDKMCVNQKCVSVPTDESKCQGGCSGHGICNSKGNCHCDRGYAPPSCDRPGDGGSYDSGPMRGTHGNYILSVVLFILSVILVALIAITCCCWYRLVNWWDWEGREALRGKLPCCVPCLDKCCCPVMDKITQWPLTTDTKQKWMQERASRSAPNISNVDERKICKVDLSLREGVVETDAWGAEQERLMHEVFSSTHKNSPNLRHKAQLPSNPPVLYHKSSEGLDKPPYLPSMSVDSGCVTDEDETEVREPIRSQMSMTSLISIFRRNSSTRGKTGASENENYPSKTSGSTKVMPLSRYVVDPLTQSRKSRHGTPPPENLRSKFRHSISLDATAGKRFHRVGTPPPPPPPPACNLKSNKSEENIDRGTKVPKNPFTFSPIAKPNNQTDRSEGSMNSMNNSQSPANMMSKKAMLPPQRSNTTPVREAPALPQTNRQPPMQPKTQPPMHPRTQPPMPPIKQQLPSLGLRPTPETDEKNKVKREIEKRNESDRSKDPTKRPLMPPTKKLPLKPPTPNPSKVPLKTETQQSEDSSNKGSSVRDLTRKFE